MLTDTPSWLFVARRSRWLYLIWLGSLRKQLLWLLKHEMPGRRRDTRPRLRHTTRRKGACLPPLLGFSPQAGTIKGAVKTEVQTWESSFLWIPLSWKSSGFLWYIMHQNCRLDLGPWHSVMSTVSDQCQVKEPSSQAYLDTHSEEAGMWPSLPTTILHKQLWTVYLQLSASIQGSQTCEFHT